MTIVAQLLRVKGQTVWSVAPEVSVREAVQLMAEKDVEALPVVEGEKLVGIVSERDCARKVTSKSCCSQTTQVREIMTEEVFYVRPEQTIEECIALMLTRHIRYLLVLVDDRLVGMISMLDAVQAVLPRQKIVIQRPERRMAGNRLN